MPKMRKLIFPVLLFLAIGLVFISLSEIEQTVLVFARANLVLLAGAIILVFIYILIEAFNYRVLYLLLGIDEPYRRLLLLASASSFINVVAPSGGFGGIAVFVDDAGKRGYSRGLAAAAGALVLFMEYAGFSVVLALGMGVLFRRNDLNPGEITAALVMLVILVGLGFGIYLGAVSGERLGRSLQKIAHSLNRILWVFTKKEYFSEIAAHTFGQEISEGLGLVRNQKKNLLIPFAISTIAKGIQALILTMVFMAFEVEFSVGTVVAGFSLAYLFLVVSPTPYGIGIVESIMPMALLSLNIPWSQAVITTLVYRGITFWIPLALGAVSLKILEQAD